MSIDPDALKRAAGETAAASLDFLDDPEVVEAIKHFSQKTIGLIGTLQVKGMSNGDIAGFVGGAFSRVLHDANGR